VVFRSNCHNRDYACGNKGQVSWRTECFCSRAFGIAQRTINERQVNTLAIIQLQTLIRSNTDQDADAENRL